MLSHPDIAMAEARPAAGAMAGVHCLVLGAGGFLGGALCAALRAEGAVVHAYGRSLPNLAQAAPGLRTEAAFEDATALAAALREQEVVFHLASSSLPAESNRDPVGDVAGQVVPSIRLLERCRAAGVRKVVFASSGGTVYGIPATVPTPEHAGTAPITAYGINKRMVEHYLELFWRLHGLDYHVLRIANPYGPGQSPFKPQGVVAAMLHRALSGLAIELWGTGEVTRDFIHVDDVSSAFIAAARYAGPHRVMNVGSGHGRSLNQLIADVRAALGGPALEVVRKGGRAADVPVSVLDTALIRRATGWRPGVAWMDGLAGTAAWMRGAYGL
jgi:UDP-glucose 4-epimerase